MTGIYGTSLSSLLRREDDALSDLRIAENAIAYWKTKLDPTDPITKDIIDPRIHERDEAKAKLNKVRHEMEEYFMSVMGLVRYTQI